jgi:hypothetical protein
MHEPIWFRSLVPFEALVTLTSCNWCQYGSDLLYLLRLWWLSLAIIDGSFKVFQQSFDTKILRMRRMQFSVPVAIEDLLEWEKFSGSKLTQVDRRRISFLYTNQTWIQQISTIAKLFRLTCNVVSWKTSLTVASRVLSLISGKPLLSI